MRGADFLDIRKHKPEPGHYQWKAPFGAVVPVEFRDGAWYLKNGDRLPGDVVRYYRKNN